jgi:D-alanyl-D-alanine carboxypeptidase/D-alanyl-D-alanine-endopeptidase (penicillin-binding protein 4)
MRDTPAERRLRAKTGTLHGVSALSGYVADPNGDLVVFSALSQNLQNGVSGVWQIQNAIGAALASNGSFHAEPDGGDAEGEQVSDASGAAPKPEASAGGAP